jgi:hypothetical protein
MEKMKPLTGSYRKRNQGSEKMRSGMMMTDKIQARRGEKMLSEGRKDFEE